MGVRGGSDSSGAPDVEDQAASGGCRCGVHHIGGRNVWPRVAQLGRHASGGAEGQHKRTWDWPRRGTVMRLRDPWRGRDSPRRRVDGSCELRAGASGWLKISRNVWDDKMRSGGAPSVWLAGRRESSWLRRGSSTGGCERPFCGQSSGAGVSYSPKGCEEYFEGDVWRDERVAHVAACRGERPISTGKKHYFDVVSRPQCSQSYRNALQRDIRRYEHARSSQEGRECSPLESASNDAPVIS